MGAPGLEPGTSALSGPRSNQLSYAPGCCSLWCACRRWRSRSLCSPWSSRLSQGAPSASGVPAARSTSLFAKELTGTGALQTEFFTHLLDLGCIPCQHGGMLPRKEVIQPQLPLRLPCYDFVPIIHPTLDGCLPIKGLAHRLQVLPTFVT